ncbi:hypothetical protein DZK27_14155 [Rhodobacteraceae bacterium 63075]|nr:hypothetical protein DZK27_14155 [Rhodobacteraceae bacterium 63075]
MGSGDQSRIRQTCGAAELLESRYDQQRLAYVKAKEAVERLEQGLTVLARSGDGAKGPEFQASGAAMAWRLWAEQRRETILSALANARAAEAQEKDKLRQAYSRMHAMKSIAEKLQDERKSVAARKLADEMGERIVAAAVCNQ